MIRRRYCANMGLARDEEDDKRPLEAVGNIFFFSHRALDSLEICDNFRPQSLR